MIYYKIQIYYINNFFSISKYSKKVASIKFIYLYWGHVKVAGVVRLKLAFMEWFLYNLVILIKLYKIRYPDKALLFPRNQAICMKIENWRVPAATKFNIFLLKFLHTFPT